jgi:hypothetical protein
MNTLPRRSMARAPANRQLGVVAAIAWSVLSCGMTQKHPATTPPPPDQCKTGPSTIPPPSPGQCKTVAIKIFPNGSIVFSAHGDRNLFCLAEDSHDGLGWGQPGDVSVTQRSADGRDLSVEGVQGDTPVPIQPPCADPQDVVRTTIKVRPRAIHLYYDLTTNDDFIAKAMRIVVEDETSAAKDEASKAKRPFDSDRFKKQFDVEPEKSKIKAKAISEIRSAIDSYPPVTVFDGFLPAATMQSLVSLDASGNAGRVSDDFLDGTGVNAWAYNVSCETAQKLTIQRGEPIASGTAILTQVLKVALNTHDFSKSITSFETTTDTISGLVNKTLAAAPAKHYCGTSFTSSVVDGGYGYIIQAAPSDPIKPDPTKPESQKASPVQRDGSVSFKTHVRHRDWSLGVELAWSKSLNKFPSTGYAYQPIAQSGPDQLYRLQEIDHLQDAITTSALMLVYPLNIIAHWDAWPNECPFVRDHLAIGFGPTFLRGGTGEFARQWNLRGGLELSADLLLTVGLSWRAMDIPDVPGVDVNSIVSVQRPAMTPTFATAQQIDRTLSIGLTIDLDFLSGPAAGAVAAVNKTAGGKSGSDQ